MTSKKNGYNYKKHIITSIVINCACKPISLILSYLYVPIVMEYLGNEKYGIWAVFLGILSWIYSFDIGIGNGLRNELTKAITQNEQERCSRLVASSYASLSIIIIPILFIAALLSIILDWNKILNTNQEYNYLSFVILISFVCVSVNFVLSLCNSVLYAIQKSHFVSVSSVFCQTISLLLILYISKNSNGNMLYVAIVDGGAIIITSILTSVLLYSIRSDLRPLHKNIDIGLGKSLTATGFRFFIIQICALVLFSTDNLIISHLYGAEAVTPYSLVIKLYSALTIAHSTLIVPFWSASTKAKASKDIVQLKKMVNSMFFILIPFVLFSIIVAIYFKPIAHIWLRQDLEFQDELIWLGLVYCIIYLWCSTIGTVASGIGILKFFSIIAVIQASVNIPLSILLATVFRMKTFGILLGTIFAMSISAVAITIAVYREINRQSIESKIYTNYE